MFEYLNKMLYFYLVKFIETKKAELDNTKIKQEANKSTRRKTISKNKNTLKNKENAYKGAVGQIYN